MVSSRVAIEKEYKNYFFPDMGKVLFGFYSLVALTGLSTNSMFGCLLFVRIIDLPGGHINYTCSGLGRCSLLFLLATPWSCSQTLEVLFELTRCPSKALTLALCVALGTSEIQGRS